MTPFRSPSSTRMATERSTSRSLCTSFPTLSQPILGTHIQSFRLLRCFFGPTADAHSIALAANLIRPWTNFMLWQTCAGSVKRTRSLSMQLGKPSAPRIDCNRTTPTKRCETNRIWQQALWLQLITHRIHFEHRGTTVMGHLLSFQARREARLEDVFMRFDLDESGMTHV